MCILLIKFPRLVICFSAQEGNALYDHFRHAKTYSYGLWMLIYIFVMVEITRLLKNNRSATGNKSSMRATR